MTPTRQLTCRVSQSGLRYKKIGGRVSRVECAGEHQYDLAFLHPHAINQAQLRSMYPASGRFTGPVDGPYYRPGPDDEPVNNQIARNVGAMLEWFAGLGVETPGYAAVDCRVLSLPEAKNPWTKRWNHRDTDRVWVVVTVIPEAWAARAATPADLLVAGLLQMCGVRTAVDDVVQHDWDGRQFYLPDHTPNGRHCGRWHQSDRLPGGVVSAVSVLRNLALSRRVPFGWGRPTPATEWGRRAQDQMRESQAGADARREADARNAILEWCRAQPSAAGLLA